MENKSEDSAVNKNKLYILCLVAIILFHLINNAIWLYFDKTYLLNDSHWHFLFSLKVFDYLGQHSLPWLSDIFADFSTYRWHGVFVGFLTAPFYFIFGVSQDAGVMINNAVFLTVLILSVFSLGKLLFNQKVGVLSAFILSMYPLVFNQQRIYMLDLPLTSLVTLGMFLLLKSDNFSNRKYSWFFALVCGFGMLTKFNFALFMLGPLAIVLQKAFKNHGNRRVKFNITVIFCIVVLISFTFYRLKLWEIINRIYFCSWFYSVRYYPGEGVFSILLKSLSMGFGYLFWFLEDCINNSVSCILFVLFLAGLFARHKNKQLLYTWLFLPLLILAFLFHYPNINRYYMPVLPVMAIISSQGVLAIKKLVIRRTLIALIIALSCIQYFAISYNIKFFPSLVQMRIPFTANAQLCSINLFNRTIGYEYRSDLSSFSYPKVAYGLNKEILAEILRYTKNTKHKTTIFFIGNNPEIYEPVGFELFIRKIPVIINLVSPAEEVKYKDNASTAFMIATADLVSVIKEKEENNTTPNFVRNRLNEANALFEKNIGQFLLIKEFVLQNKTTLSLYKRKADFVKISNSGLELYFRNGVTKIYYFGEEITSDFALRIGFKINQKRYVTPSFTWKIEECSNNRLVVYGKTDDLPLSIRWDIDIINSREILWKVSLKAASEIKISSLYISLGAFAKNYNEWKAYPRKGGFSSRKIHDYSDIALTGLKIQSISLLPRVKNIFPKITFLNDNTSGFIPLIDWNNELRIIGFFKKTQQLLLDQENIFSGIITFSAQSKESVK